MLAEYGLKQKELEERTAQDRAAWSVEESGRELELKEYEENLKKQRQREKEEFEYQKTL